VNRKADFFLQNESIRIDSHNESNRFESRIGMLYPLVVEAPGQLPSLPPPPKSGPVLVQSSRPPPAWVPKREGEPTLTNLPIINDNYLLNFEPNDS